MADKAEWVCGLGHVPLSGAVPVFNLPALMAPEKFITQLSFLVDARLVNRQQAVKTYYDSFDWRIYSNGMLAEVNAVKNTSVFLLRDFASNLVISSAELNVIPTFSWQFGQEKLGGILGPILEMRALSPVCKLDLDCFQVNVINKDEKIVLRLFIESYGVLNCSRVVLRPIRGYDKFAEHVVTVMIAKLALTPANAPVLLEALERQGMRPNNYSAKLDINLAPELRADIACKYIYSHLLKIIKANEQGVVADIDSEFLHDYRVAIRKTRSGLSQLKGLLPETEQAKFSGFFSWLGQITTPTRDLDVYLLKFEPYKDSLPVQVREDLEPLRGFLWKKKREAHSELAKKLSSGQYVTMLSEWEVFLKERVAFNPIGLNAKLTIKQLADLRIWKVYRRVLREGDAISGQSEPEALHELRKTCKKLRYLMEFFESLYPKQDIKKLLRHLKRLQEVLGDFQDCQVQENHLRLFSEEMLADGQFSAKTFLAMGMLIQHVDGSKQKARAQFSVAFLAFKAYGNHKLFQKLFTDKTASKCG